jgi:hypothetical protein
MFCRFCGAPITVGSHFCSTCGKRLLTPPSARTQVWLSKLRLDTPYPYAGFFFLLFVLWVIQPRQSGVDYSKVRFELQLEGESGRPEENVFRHHLSLIVENVSSEPVRELPVEFRVRVDPERTGEVVSDFLGRRLVIHRDGESMPLIVVLADLVEASGKRRYTIDGIVTMEPPANITYEVLAEGSEDVLASLAATIQRPPVSTTDPVAQLFWGR